MLRTMKKEKPISESLKTKDYTVYLLKFIYRFEFCVHWNCQLMTSCCVLVAYTMYEMEKNEIFTSHEVSSITTMKILF